MEQGGISYNQKSRERKELIVQDDSSNESNESDYPIVPPDGGWGWMVVLSSFVIHVIADGIVYSFGVFLMEFVVYFKSGRSATSLIGALQPAVTFTVGPLASVLTNRYGCRKVTIAGSLIAASGFVMSTFAPHLYYLYFTSGIMAGVGFGLIYLPAIVCVAQYFKKRRSFATGLAVCGSGFGTFILAPLIEMLVHKFSWQGAMLILGGVILNVTVCGVIFRPLKADVGSRREMSPHPEGEEVCVSTDLENSVPREDKDNRYVLKVENFAVNERITVEKYPHDGDVKDTKEVLTSHRTFNINNNLQWLSRKVNDKIVFMDENNCSHSSNHPSTSATTDVLDEVSSDPLTTDNTGEITESTGSSEKEHAWFQGFKRRNNLHELKNTGGHNPKSSHSLDHVLQSQNKQDAIAGPRFCQSAMCLLQNSISSTPEFQNSRDKLSDPQNIPDTVSVPQEDQYSSSYDQSNGGTLSGSQDSLESLSDSHEKQNTESDPKSNQDSTPHSQHSHYPTSKSQSIQNNISERHHTFKDREDALSKLAHSTSTLSEQQRNLCDNPHSQHDLSEFQKTRSFATDPSSTRCLVSRHRHGVACIAQSDSILHLQLALRYKLRTGVLAPKSKSQSCLVAYKPLRRKDILYISTIKIAPLYRPKQDVYTTVTSVPDHVMRSGLPRKGDKTCKGCLAFSQDLRAALREMMSVSLLRNPVFLMFALSNFLTSLGFNVPFIFLPDRAKLAGIDEKSAALLLSWIGIANTAGRIFFGFLSDRPWVNRLVLYSTALTICGVVTALSPLLGDDYGLLVTYATIFGVFIGVYVSLTSIVLVDLLGLEYLTNSFGLLLLFQGAATFVGPPFAGWLCDWTGSYDSSFMVMGSLLALSGAMLYFLPLVERYHARRIGNPDTEHDDQLGQNPMAAEDLETLNSDRITSVV